MFSTVGFGSLFVEVSREQAYMHPRRLRARDVKPAVGKRTVIARRQEQVSSAFAAVGAGEPDVDDPLEPHVVDGAEPFGGCSITMGPFVRSTIAM